jgi:hypothetical protein
MRGGWNQINSALREAFEGVSLAAMAFPAIVPLTELAEPTRAKQ